MEVNNELFFMSSFSLQLRKPCQNEENGLYFSLGAISSHGTSKWHLVRDKNHFIFFTPVTVNKYSFLKLFMVFLTAMKFVEI